MERKEIEKKELQLTVNLLQRGSFLSCIEKDWMDDLKDEITTSILTFLEIQINHLNVKEDTILILDITNVMFKFDRLNEKALEVKCKVLSGLGKHNNAMETYEHFTRLYQKCYNEQFNIPFKGLIKK